MSTEIIDAGKINEVIKFNVTDATIEKLRQDYMPLVVNGLDDKEGYEKCHRARIEVSKLRGDVEERRVELKSEALEFGRRVDWEAKRISGQLQDIEDHLKRQKEVVDNEKKRIKEEFERKAKEILDARIAQLQKFHAIFTIDEVKAMRTDEFNDFSEKAHNDFMIEQMKANAEKERLAKLEAENQDHQKKINEQAAENKRIRDELEARLRSENAEKQRQLDEERAARDKERQERIADEQKAKQEVERKKSEELEAKRKEDDAKRKAEAEAARKVADKKLFEEIKTKFPTIESAWVEIARLTKLSR